MDEVTLRVFPKSHQEFLASVWLQQQDLKDKSPTEISDMYYKALREIWENYARNYKPRTQPQRERRTISRGIPVDEW